MSLVKVERLKAGDVFKFNRKGTRSRFTVLNVQDMAEMENSPRPGFIQLLVNRSARMVVKSKTLVKRL